MNPFVAIYLVTFGDLEFVEALEWDLSLLYMFCYASAGSSSFK